MTMSHRAFALQVPPAQPLVCPSESLAAMIILAIIDAKRAPIANDRSVVLHAVWNAGEQFRQVERGIAVVADSEKKHLPVEIVDTTDGAARCVRRSRE